MEWCISKYFLHVPHHNYIKLLQFQNESQLFFFTIKHRHTNKIGKVHLKIKLEYLF